MATDPVAAEFFQQQRLKDPSNDKCCDRGESHRADWASVSHGIYISIEASGIHRSLGVKTSFVQSTTMDSWKPVHLRMMELGGNRRFQEFMREHGIPEDMPIRRKYSTRAAAWYRENLRAEAEGLELPAPLSPGTGHLMVEGSTVHEALLDEVFAAAPSSGVMTAGGVMLPSRRTPERRQSGGSPPLTASGMVTEAAVFGEQVAKKLKAALKVGKRSSSRQSSAASSTTCSSQSSPRSVESASPSGFINGLKKASSPSKPPPANWPWSSEGRCVASRLKTLSTGSMDGFGSESALARGLAVAGGA